MAYVDGFLLPVPKKNVAWYRRLARKAGKIWREHGALEYRECLADDLNAEGMTSFAKRARLKRNETLFFSWIVYRSKADRKRVIAKVMSDKRLEAMMDPRNSPFDVKRMSYGGFKPVVDL